MLFVGIAGIACSIAYFFAIFAAPRTSSPKKFALDALKASAFSLIAGVSTLVLGIISIAMWVFTLPRIPVRLIITHYTDKNKLCVEHNAGYQRLDNLYKNVATSELTKKRIAAAMIAKSYIDIHQKQQKTHALETDINYIEAQYHTLFGKDNLFPQSVTDIDKKVIDHAKVIRLFSQLRSENENRIAKAANKKMKRM